MGLIRTDEAKLLWQCTMGSKSHLNPLGKVVFFPFATFLTVMFVVFETLFEKRTAECPPRDSEP